MWDGLVRSGSCATAMRPLGPEEDDEGEGGTEAAGDATDA